MTLTIEINLDNDAFVDNGYLNTAEVQRVAVKATGSLGMLPLGKVADRSGKVLDSNGNTVCEWAVL